MKGLGLEVKTLEKPMYVSSPLGTRVSVDQICQDYELEISGILLTMDLKVLDVSKFDVILGIDCHARRIPARPEMASPNRSPGRDTIYTISIYYAVLGLSLTCSFSELYLYLLVHKQFQ